MLCGLRTLQRNPRRAQRDPRPRPNEYHQIEGQIHELNRVRITVILQTYKFVKIVISFLWQTQTCSTSVKVYALGQEMKKMREWKAGRSSFFVHVRPFPLRISAPSFVLKSSPLSSSG